MASNIEDLLANPIQLADAVKKALEENDAFKNESVELIEKIDKLANLLRTSLRLFSDGSANFYDRPTNRIVAEVVKSLEKALQLLKKCKRPGMLRRTHNMISAADFNKLDSSLECSIGDVSWLLDVSLHGRGGKKRGIEGLPPIASTDPMLAWVWGQVALVHSGSLTEKEEGANYLASLAADNDRNRRLIIEEGGVKPLLRLLKEGATVAGRVAAANALGVLGTDQESVQKIDAEGAGSTFVQILQDAPMKVQAKVAWAIAKMVSQAPDACAFSKENIIRPLVSLLVFETMDINPHKPSRSQTMHSVGRSGLPLKSPSPVDGRSGWPLMKSVMSDGPRMKSAMFDGPLLKSVMSDGPLMRSIMYVANERLEDQWDTKSTYSVDSRPKQIRHSRGYSDSYYHGLSKRELQKKEREKEDPEVKKDLKIQITAALWKLAENNVQNSRKITDTKALTCFAKLIEKETGELQRNSVMAVMEISGAAERDVELRRFAFKTNSNSAKTIIDQLLKVIENCDNDLQVPCLRAIGCLSRSFPARETKVIGPLVQQLHNCEPEVAAEAALALQKFAHQDNFLHQEHSKTILDAKAVPRLVQLVSLDDKDVQVPALLLLCSLAVNVGNHDSFREASVLKVLRTLARNNVSHIQSVSEVLPLAVKSLELYQAGSKY